MKKMLLTGTDLEVSNLCIGTVSYGLTLSQDECEAQLERFLELGGNFVDTAHIYSDWVPGEIGRSEKTLGRWLAKGRNRERVILSTKGAHPKFSDFSAKRVRPEYILEDISLSLEYLQTDCVDLYFLHRDDPSVPVGELLDCLNGLRSEGKIRYLGCSNWTVGRIKEFQLQAEKKGVPGFSVNQAMWSLARINVDSMGEKIPVMDEETYEYHKASKLSLMAYSSQGRGFFSQKAKGDVSKANALTYENEANSRLFEKLKAISLETGLSFTDLVLAFFLDHPFPAIPIISCSSMEHLEECAKAAAIEAKPEYGLVF
ncbi:MAG: aldo/keto reductase [Clostridiales bacterium]|jgi:aryl-alcohol dehydrogenase-like predicted oxidoreductase|nr:aldo/keto reductase [Clostridiales bacterium]